MAWEPAGLREGVAHCAKQGARVGAAGGGGDGGGGGGAAGEPASKGVSAMMLDFLFCRDATSEEEPGFS